MRNAIRLPKFPNKRPFRKINKNPRRSCPGGSIKKAPPAFGRPSACLDKPITTIHQHRVGLKKKLTLIMIYKTNIQSTICILLGYNKARGPASHRIPAAIHK
jgi:hypothetical protein